MSAPKLKRYWKESKGAIVSLAVIGAILPVALWGAMSRQQLFTWARADSAVALRIWMEPAEVVMRQGDTVTLTVMADYPSQTGLIPSLTADVISGVGVVATPVKVVNSGGFAGRVKLGTVAVLAERPGSFTVAIPESSVFTSLPNLPIVTAGAQIVVR